MFIMKNVLDRSHIPIIGEVCNVPNSASLGNTAKLSNPLSDLILWGFMDAFQLMF
jgi:hypothetical protein